MIKLFVGKYKKQVAILCLFTFLFIPFNPSLKPKAEILALTTGGILACAGLAVACGVVITNPDMLEDIGNRIYDGIKSIPGAIDNIGDNFKINVNKNVLETVHSIALNLPKITTAVEIYRKWFHSNGDTVVSFPSAYTGSFSMTVTERIAKTRLYSNSTGKKWGEYTVNLEAGTYEMVMTKTKHSSYGDMLSFELAGKWVYSIPYSALETGFNLIFLNTYGGSICVDVNDILHIPQSVDIPYTEDNSIGVSVDKPLQYFPSGSGSISVPNDRPITYNPSVDNPISIPGDILEDGDITSDSNTDTGTDTDTSVDTGSKLLDTLIEFLKTLFAPITLLLEKILDLIQSIVNFFNPSFEMPAFPNIYPNYDITGLFDFSRLWNVQPTKPRWTINGFWSGLKHNMSSDDVEINLFDIPQIEENIDIIRNFTTYPLLISVMWFIIKHFAPRRIYE